MARELRPDLVIMDIKMPELDGVKAAKILAEEHIAPSSCSPRSPSRIW